MQCSKCKNWLHIKCSGLKTAKERTKFQIWLGPCCSRKNVQSTPSSKPAASPPPLPPQPSYNPPTPPSPAPPPAQPQHHANIDNNLHILQFNVNGLSGKVTQLSHFLETNNIKIAAIQETKLTKNSKLPDFPNYHLLNKNRTVKGGGGIAFLIHHSLNFQEEKTPPILENDSHLETQTISILGNNQHLQIRNIYLPPRSSCTTPDCAPPWDHISEGLNNTSLILGDFNAHHDMWFSEDNADQRGRALVDALTTIPYGIINEDLPTRITSQASTAPDLSLASNSLLTTCSWKPEVQLTSDHLPIIISLNADIKFNRAKRKNFINFSKANWEGFTEYTENIFTKVLDENRQTGNVYRDEKFFRKVLNRASAKFIPKGRIPKVANAMPTDAVNLMNERDDIRKNDPADARLEDLNKQINDKINDHRRSKWREHLDTCKNGSKKLWTTIKSLGNQPKQPDNQGIYFNDKIYHNPKKFADKFNCQYTPATNIKQPKEARNLRRQLKKKPTDPCITITEADTAKAIKESKNSKALGPDNISPIMLKHLGKSGIKYLTNIFNKSVNTAIIPTVWKTARIIPLLKPSKPSDQGPSYRPISLLSPAAKILEKILLPEISQAANLQSHQHGFRKLHSTTTALQEMSTYITNGLNMNKPVKRTVAVAIDLSRAFDTVDHNILLDDINNLQLNQHLKRFLCSYLRGRVTYVEFRGSRSKFRKMKQGVPQGGVLSPLLFNIYMTKMPTPPNHMKLTTYADDSTVLNSGEADSNFDHKELSAELNSYLNILFLWFKARNLEISPTKSTATIFTTAPNEAGLDLPIYINGTKVPTVQKPKILGVTLDNLFNFSEHANQMKSKIGQRNNVLKALSGTTWGKEKETLLSTYKATSQSILNYCAPIWGPNLCKSKFEELQRQQNTALRTTTGCVKMTGIDHLHSECEIMPVKDHCYMLSKQFLLASQLPEHPNNIDLHTPHTGRIMKKTLKTRFGEEIKQIIPPSGHTKDIHKAKIKQIHTKSVRDSIARQEPNPVLGFPAPKVNVTEKELPRQTRTRLAQLRSGYSSNLNSYLSRIREDTDDICPDCNAPNYTTNHLFNCPSKPTPLTALSLWTNPKDAATFLGLPGQEFDDHG